jgi:hypothetical protein
MNELLIKNWILSFEFAAQIFLKIYIKIIFL